jgi:biotin carboxyl carrier protein
MSIEVSTDSSVYLVEKKQETWFINEKETDFSFQWIKKPDLIHVVFQNQSYTALVHKINKEEKTVELTVGIKKFTLKLADDKDRLLKSLGFDKLLQKNIANLKAPMPGLVLKIIANVGDEVKKGEPLLILEAMKMENMIKAPADVKIKQIAVSEKQAVDKNQLLVEFES